MRAPPKTVEDALNLLMSILDKETIEIFASRSENELKHYHCTAGVLIRKQFRLTEGNDELIESCRRYSGQPDLDGRRASIVILKALWESLRQTKH
ncbi:DUF6794 domain-containing protein [Thermodesulfobacteriota bacterium]